MKSSRNSTSRRALPKSLLAAVVLILVFMLWKSLRASDIDQLEQVGWKESTDNFRSKIEIKDDIELQRVATRAENFPSCFLDLYSVDLSTDFDLAADFHCGEVATFEHDDFSLSKSAGKRYFFYSPSGGLSNQRSELEYAILVCNDINRIPVFPKLAKHTSLWTRYAKLSHESLLPLEAVFDLNHLKKFVPEFVVTNLTVVELENKFTESQRTTDPMLFKKLYYSKRQYWKGKEQIYEKLGGFSEKVLFLKGSTMYHNWYSTETSYQVSEYFVFNAWLRRYAAEIAKQLGPNFNAIHVRLGDYFARGKVPDLGKILDQMSDFGRHVPLYIATEPTDDDDIFQVFKKRFPTVYFSTDFSFVKEHLKAKFGENAMVDDLLGIVEQLVCVLADNFAGTGYSNFSRYIRQMRKLGVKAFPEKDYVKNQISFHNDLI